MASQVRARSILAAESGGKDHLPDSPTCLLHTLPSLPPSQHPQPIDLLFIPSHLVPFDFLDCFGFAWWIGSEVRKGGEMGT